MQIIKALYLKNNFKKDSEFFKKDLMKLLAIHCKEYFTFKVQVDPKKYRTSIRIP